nr:hypothetical protein [Angustibacter aerolatus]
MHVFDPSQPVEEIQAEVDAVAAQQIANQFGDERVALLFKPGTYGSAEHPLTFQVGYYTEVAGLGQSPTDVTINGAVDVANQCEPAPTDTDPNAQSLHRAEQLLALDLEPHHQRDGPGRLPVGHRVLGGLAGRADAPGERHERPPVADGLLLGRPAVRERRVHRGLRRVGRHDQRQPAAVLRARQQPRRRLEQRGLEPGVLRHLGRPGAEPSRPDVHHPAQHAGEPGEAVPVRRREGRLARLRARHAPRRGRHQAAGRPDQGHLAPAERLLRRDAGRLGEADRPRACARGRTCCSPRASTTSTARSTSCAATRSCSVSACRR